MDREELNTVPFRSDRVEFIEEQYTRLRSTGPLEELTDRLLTCADVLVQDLGTLDADEV